MLEVEQLSRKYGSFLAVDNVGFAINRGEIVGLLGHNGAGKSTIMKMISGYLDCNSGTIKINDIDLQSNPKEAKRMLGYLPENLPIYPDMTVADYLDFAAELKGLRSDAKNAETKWVVNATDITEKLISPISELSRGYRQRVGVAQAILGRPKLLVLDEPTNGLDPEQTQRMRALIRYISKDATVVLSTHIMQEVEALCSRLLMLHGGGLALDSKLEDLRCDNQLLLETSLARNNKALISDIVGVSCVDVLGQSDDSTTYRVKFVKSADQKCLAANIAKMIAKNSESLFVLQPEMRNLENIFKDLENEGNKNGRIE